MFYAFTERNLENSEGMERKDIWDSISWLLCMAQQAEISLNYSPLIINPGKSLTF